MDAAIHSKIKGEALILSFFFYSIGSDVQAPQSNPAPAKNVSNDLEFII